MRAALADGFASSHLLTDLGGEVVSVRVEPVKPLPEVERALEAPTRERVQEEADEAAFRRRAQAVDKADTANGLALAADIVGVAGLLGLGAAAFLFMVDQGGSSERATAARGASIAVHPAFSRDHAGLTLRGTF